MRAAQLTRWRQPLASVNPPDPDTEPRPDEVGPQVPVCGGCRSDGRAISGKLAFFGTRGMPVWRYPGVRGLIAGNQVDLSRRVMRHISLSEASAELAAFDGPTPSGAAVIIDFKP